MEYKIQNDKVVVKISSQGGELQSIKGNGLEYLWQGDIKTWSDKTINIFPYVSSLTNNCYKYQNKIYHMEPHGFVKNTQLTVVERGREQVTFGFKSNEITMQKYPFEFLYYIRYELVKSNLIITYKVENMNRKNMYFGLGGHIGFCVPLESNTKFEDYILEFKEEGKPIRVGINKNCLRTGEDVPYKLREDKYLELEHGLFEDAVILKNMSKHITLRSKKSNHGVTIIYPQMNYLGIWHMPRTNRNYVCIEPFSSLPSRDGIIENIEQQEDLICVYAGRTYENTWSIELF